MEPWMSDAVPEQQAPNGGLFALLHGRGVLAMVRNGLPFSMFDELVGAVGGSQRELAAVIGIPATTLARRKRSGMLTPHDLLDRETPLERASTETGARDVELLVGRLRHGVFG